jgi:hypothetical protein
VKSAPWNRIGVLLPTAVLSSVLWRYRLSILYSFPPWGHGGRDLGATLVLGVLAIVGPAAALAGTTLARRARR